MGIFKAFITCALNIFWEEYLNQYALLNVFTRNEQSHKEFEKVTEEYINKITRLKEKCNIGKSKSDEYEYKHYHGHQYLDQN